MEFLNEFILAGKDAILSQIVSHLINPKLEPYQGVLEHISLDSLNKTVSLSVNFEGESKPVEFTIRYQVADLDGKSHIHVLHFDSNRPWIALILNDLLQREKLPSHHEIPSVVVPIL